LFNVFLEAFEVAASSENNVDVSINAQIYVMAHANSLLKQENRAIAAFKELVVKLNDAAFIPLMRRLYDGHLGMQKVSSAHAFFQMTTEK